MDDSSSKRAAPASGRVGLRDVARLAGVSHITVSRVLRAPEKVAEHTRRKVERVVAAVGYIPNLVAGSLSSNRTRIIAAVVPSLRNSVAAEFTEGMSDVLDRNGFHLMIGSSRLSPAAEEALVRAFLGRQAQAIYLYGGTHSDGVRALLAATGVPTVEVGMLPVQPIDMAVGHSDFDGARDMTRLLIATGRCRIGFVSFPTEDNLRESERRRGYVAALAEAGLAPEPGLQAAVPFAAGSGGRAIAILLERRPDIDAALCSSDILAAEALAACHERKLAVPGAIAIAGYGDLQIARLVRPALTTIRTPRYAIGARAAQMLLDRLAGAPVAPRVVDMGYELVRRDSA